MRAGWRRCAPAVGIMVLVYVAVSAFAVYAHFFAAFVVVAHGVAVLVAGSARELRQQVLRTLAVGTLCTPLGLFIAANETQPAKREARQAILAAIGSTAGQVAGPEVRLFEPPPRPE